MRAYVGEKLIRSEDDTFHEQCSINDGSHLREGTLIVSLTLNTTDVLQKWTKNESVPITFHAGHYTKTSYLTLTEDCQCCTCNYPTKVVGCNASTTPDATVNELEVTNNTLVYTLTGSTLDNETGGTLSKVDSVMTTTDKTIALSTQYFYHIISFLVTIYALGCVL